MSSPTIPVELLDRLQQIADHQQRTVAEVLSTLLDEAYPIPAPPPPPAFDRAAWWAKVDALQASIRATHGLNYVVGSQELLDELRDEAS